MKFGALLRNSAAELPELHQLFVSYKQLKKRLKRLPERQELVRQRVRVAGGELPEVDVREVRQQEEAFVQILDQDVQNFNRYSVLGKEVLKEVPTTQCSDVTTQACHFQC